jgi:hypothetical protein
MYDRFFTYRVNLMWRGMHFYSGPSFETFEEAERHALAVSKNWDGTVKVAYPIGEIPEKDSFYCNGAERIMTY